MKTLMQSAVPGATLKKFTPAERRRLERPEEYIGVAPEVTRSVTALWRDKLKGVLPE